MKGANARALVLAGLACATVFQQPSLALAGNCRLKFPKTTEFVRSFNIVLGRVNSKASRRLLRLPNTIFEYNVTPLFIGFGNESTLLFPRFLNPTLHGTNAPTLAPPKMLARIEDIATAFGPFIRLNKPIKSRNRLFQGRVSFFGKIPSLIFVSQDLLADYSKAQIQLIGDNIVRTINPNYESKFKYEYKKSLNNDFCHINRFSNNLHGNIFTIIIIKSNENGKNLKTCYGVGVLLHYGFSGINFGNYKKYLFIREKGLSGSADSYRVFLAIYGQSDPNSAHRFSGLPNLADDCRVANELDRALKIDIR